MGIRLLIILWKRIMSLISNLYERGRIFACRHLVIYTRCEWYDNSSSQRIHFRHFFWKFSNLSSNVLPVGLQASEQCPNWLRTIVRYSIRLCFISVTKWQVRFNSPYFWLALFIIILQCSLKLKLVLIFIPRAFSLSAYARRFSARW